jgi:hypothetical protein
VTDISPEVRELLSWLAIFIAFLLTLTVLAVVHQPRNPGD